jgi:hypothetical protein
MVSARVPPIHLPNLNRNRSLELSYGDFLHELGRNTVPGYWQFFGTITFRTPYERWQKGFPFSHSRPTPDFAHTLFQEFVAFLERTLRSRVDYVVADQFGSIGGRFHQHCLLAADGLDIYPRKRIEHWWFARAGYSRVLPYKAGAAHYIGRFVGYDIASANCHFQIGPNSRPSRKPEPVGNIDVTVSPELPRNMFHMTLKGRHR